MDEDITQRQQSPGRILNVVVFGDTADEVELAALDEARAFFGDGRQLEIVPDYKVSGTIPLDGTDKKYRAAVNVRTVEPMSET
jgi:hypothetical protein